MQNIIQHDDLSKPVYDRLKEMIEKGELPPGQKLVQEKLAVELGVSRTPLLKALQSLEHEMLVESIPRRGVYVKKISTEEMVHVYDCREAVECMAVRLAIEKSSEKELLQFSKIFEAYTNIEKIEREKYRKSDEKFHDLIVDLSKNPILKRMSNVSQVHKRVYLYGLLRPPEETLEEHLKITEAIINRDQILAEEHLKNHIRLSRSRLIETLP